MSFFKMGRSTSNALFWLLALTLVNSFAVINTVQANSIWASAIGSVELVTSESDTVNQHPQTFLKNELLVALKSVKVQQKRGLAFWNYGKTLDEVSALFSDEEARLLAHHLAAAFKLAGGNEDIIFTLQRKKSTDLTRLVSSTVISTGRMFIDNDQLNIIFGEAWGKPTRGLDNTPITRRYAGISVSQDTVRPGSRLKQSRLAVALVEGGILKIATDNRKQRKDWVRVSLDSFREDSRALSSYDQSTAQASPKQIIEDFDTLSSAEAKLDKLTRYYEKGLMSDEVYNRLTQAILENAL